MEQWYKQENECCGGWTYLVVGHGSRVIRGFVPNCHGLVEYTSEEPPLGGLPYLAASASEISEVEYLKALGDTGL